MQPNASPEGPETPRRVDAKAVPPKVAPRRPHSGEQPDRAAGQGRADTATTESDASSPEKVSGTQPGLSLSPGPGGPQPPASAAFSERIGKKLSAVGAEADKWAGASAGGGSPAGGRAAGSLSLSPLDQLIVRPASPKLSSSSARSSAQSDSESQ